MGTKAFDRKFGAELLRDLPASPAVYLFKDEDGTVIYAGKAKNIRRRLQSYRNAGRKKADRKMSRLVRHAHSLEVRLQDSEQDALLVENELIRELRPRYNVEGAFSFLYPSIGITGHEGRTLLAISTQSEAYEALRFRWFGSFRSRLRARDAFDALEALLDRIGHREPRQRLPELPRVRGSRVVGFRRVAAFEAGLTRFLAGEDTAILSELSTVLLEKPDARDEAAEVGEDLRLLAAFFESDARPLHDALRAAGRAGSFVPQHERDALFIAHGRVATT